MLSSVILNLVFSHAAFHCLSCFTWSAKILPGAFERDLPREGKAVAVSLKERWVKIKRAIMQTNHMIREKKKVASD